MSAAAAAGGESRFAMSGDVRIVTERLGGSPLSLLAQDDGAPALFPRRPATVEAWRERAGQVRADGRHAWLDSLGEAFGPASGNAADRLARVAGGHGVVVTTGQQPGLFGGPVYTWTKALSARALADAIESATGIPTAPVFWAATDDSDLAEAAGTVLSGRAGAERIALDVSAPDGTRMADIPLPDMAALLARLGRRAVRWLTRGRSNWLVRRGARRTRSAVRTWRCFVASSSRSGSRSWMRRIPR